MRRKRFIVIALLVGACLTPASPAQPSPPAPDGPMNVLFILSDDQRADAVGAYGHKTLRTPAIDSLVARGTSFTNAYGMGSHSGAVCGPSRAMILTGRTVNRVGNPFALAEAMTTLPERFRAAGYETFFTGKWHSGKPALARGFTHGGSIFFGGMGSHTTLPVHDFDPDGVYPNDRRHPLAEFSSAEFVSRAVEFLDDRDERGSDQPFFAMVSFTAPHDPRTPPGEYATVYDPASVPLPANFLPVHPFDNGEMTIRDEKLAPWPRTPEAVRENLAAYYGMISHMDAQIARLLTELDRLGLTDRTIIVFASDHGLAIGSHGLMGKQNLYEHSTKAPLVVVDPRARAHASSCDGLVYLYDIAPTIAELAGVTPEAWDGRGVEGRSLAACVGGCAKDRAAAGVGGCVGRPSLLTLYRDVQRAARDERWKLIVYPKINRVQLFDLANDPDEQNDLASDPARRGEVDRLLAELGRLQAEAGDETPLFNQIPARSFFDAIAAETARTGGNGDRP